MWIKRLYYLGLLILPSIILGQQLNSTISNGMEKELTLNSLLEECYSGPIVWSNCRQKERKLGRLGSTQVKFPMVYQL